MKHVKRNSVQALLATALHAVEGLMGGGQEFVKTEQVARLLDHVSATVKEEQDTQKRQRVS